MISIIKKIWRSVMPASKETEDIDVIRHISVDTERPIDTGESVPTVEVTRVPLEDIPAPADPAIEALGEEERRRRHVLGFH